MLQVPNEVISRGSTHTYLIIPSEPHHQKQKIAAEDTNLATCVAGWVFYHRMGNTLDYDPQFILNWLPRVDTQLNIVSPPPSSPPSF